MTCWNKSEGIPQIEESSTATDFEAYNGQEYTIAFPSSAGTVYGGTVKVEKDGTGKLVVDRGIMSIIASNLQLVSNAEGFFYYYNNRPSNMKVDGELKSNILVQDNVSYISPTLNVYMMNYPNSNGLRLRFGTLDSANAIATFLESNPTYIIYELATPLTFDLTPVEVTTLLGINNLWSNTGDIALTYRADTKKYIDSKIAELSAAITALGT